MVYKNDIVEDPILTSIYRGYMPQGQRFIADKIFPTVPVKVRSAKLRQLGTDFLRIYDDVFIGKNKTPEIEFTISKADGWYCEKHGLKYMLTKEDALDFGGTAGMAAGMQEAKEEFTRFLKVAKMLVREYALMSVLTDTNIITNNVTLTESDRFNNYVIKNVHRDILRGARAKIWTETGEEANTVIMSKDVKDVLIDHPVLKAEIYGTGPTPIESLNDAQLAKALKVDRILVGKVRYNAAMKGQAASMLNVWPNSLIFAYINPSSAPMRYENSLGYRFELEAPVVDSFGVNDPKGAEYVRVEDFYDDLLIEAKAAYLIKDAITAI